MGLFSRLKLGLSVSRGLNEAHLNKGLAEENGAKVLATLELLTCAEPNFVSMYLRDPMMSPCLKALHKTIAAWRDLHTAHETAAAAWQAVIDLSTQNPFDSDGIEGAKLAACKALSLSEAAHARAINLQKEYNREYGRELAHATVLLESD